ncbi:hypothetical protein LUCX_200 [Xanthomonas phage vB_XciM_LucasX]|nr:hypothetical protein LUCX_200 [Xanthomonas phage vB_XciM_LucasX]
MILIQNKEYNVDVRLFGKAHIDNRHLSTDHTRLNTNIDVPYRKFKNGMGLPKVLHVESFKIEEDQELTGAYRIELDYFGPDFHSRSKLTMLDLIEQYLTLEVPLPFAQWLQLLPQLSPNATFEAPGLFMNARGGLLLVYVCRRLLHVTVIPLGTFLLRQGQLYTLEEIGERMLADSRKRLQEDEEFLSKLNPDSIQLGETLDQSRLLSFVPHR